MISTRIGRLAAATLALTGTGVIVGLTPASAAACGALSYQAEATLSGSTWTARRAGTTVYTGTDLRAAAQAAINSLPSRTAKQNVLVRGSGSISANARISLPKIGRASCRERV